MSAYIARRIFLMIPTLLGILFVSFVVVQFAPGGPVERVIAQLSGADTGGSSRISGSSGGDFGARGQVPDEVFGAPFVPPVSDGSGQDRTLLRKASQLLQDAGIAIKDGKRLLSNGEVFKIEFLVDEPSIQPHHAPYIKNLGTLGIEATLRVVDPVQYRARVEDFDFDVTIERFSMSATPGDGMRPFFSSQAAATKGSYNLAGIANPAIDALIEKILGADNRADLTVACRAFDRVFRAGRYWVPQWYRTSHPIAYWDQFGHPKPPRYTQGVGAPENWWFDANKAAKAEQAK